MHSIFDVRDILDEIFSWLETPDLGATIQVNKAWSAASVGPLWRTVYLRDAFGLLGPVIMMDDGEESYTFSENITLDNWSRFIYYAQYVRIVSVFGVDSCAILAAKTSRSCLLKNEPKYFFPNCQFLHYFATITHDPIKHDAENHLGVLLPPTVDHVYLGGVFVGHIWFNNFCKVLATQLSSLRLFFIDPTALEKQITSSNSFDSLLTKFAPTLTHVQIPKILLTEATIGKLSQIQNLSDLFVERCQLYQEFVIVNKSANRNDGSGSFMSLKSLVFATPALEFFHPFSFPALTALNCRLPGPNVNFDIDSFLALIVRQCPSLEILDYEAWEAWDYSKAVPWSSFRPLLGCRNLVSLKFLCGGVDMTPLNFVELLQSRQAPLHWHRLEITTSRIFHFEDALLIVAKCSPRINILGLNVHDSDEDGVRRLVDILPRNTNEINIQDQLELTDKLGQAGFSFLSLSRLSLTNNRGFRPDAVGPIASLLLGLCRGRVQVVSDEMYYIRQVVGNMAAFYEELEKSTQGAVSVEAESHAHFYRLMSEKWYYNY